MIFSGFAFSLLSFLTTQQCECVMTSQWIKVCSSSCKLHCFQQETAVKQTKKMTMTAVFSYWLWGEGKGNSKNNNKNKEVIRLQLHLQCHYFGSVLSRCGFPTDGRLFRK